MKIHVHDSVYRRIEEYVEQLKWTREQVIEAAIMRFSGMEGMPLEDETIYGREDEK
jgi:hypothetical protein